MFSRLLSALAAATLLATVAPGVAHASAYSEILHVYETQGTIPACEFSSAQLNAALKSIGTYGAQYFEDFTNAIQSALSERASGACEPHRQRALPAPQRGPSGPLPPLSVTGASGGGIPAPIALMAVIGAVIALCCAAGWVVWSLAWSPRWARTWAHGWREAGYRSGGIWEEFREWMHTREG